MEFGYFEDPGGGRRGFEIVNARPDRRMRARPVRPEDVGIWRDDVPDDDVANFWSRFVPHRDFLTLRDEHGFPDPGPTRIVSMGELEVADHRVEAHRREYRRLPPLRSIGFELPGTKVTLQGWDLAFEELEDHARALERLELGTELFAAMTAAQARSDRGFNELHGRHHRASD